MLFDVVYGWRKWRPQRGFWCLLIISLCFFCSLIGFVVNLFWLLSSDRPQWVEHQQPMITIAKEDLSGNIQPTAGYDINIVQRLAGVKDIASVVVQARTVSVDLKEVPRTTVGFYSANAKTVLGLPTPFSEQNFEAKVAIVSQRFWQQHLGSSKALEENRVYFENKAVGIVGVAPRAMDKLGRVNVDIWLPDSYLHEDVPEMFVDNPNLYLDTVSNRFGFALLQQRLDLEQFQAAYVALRQQTPWPEGAFADNQFRPWVIDGFELNPNGRAALHKQAWILLLLLVGFGFIIFSGIVSAYSQQSISRQSEINLKVALGGCRRGLMVQLLAENVPALVIVAVLSPLIGGMLTYFASQMGIYQDYFVAGLEFNFGLWALAVICSLLLFLCCALLPLSRSLKGLFSRGKQGHTTKAQLVVKQGILVLQFAVITGVMFISMSLMYQELHKYLSVFVASDVVTYSPKVDGRISIMLSADQVDGNWSVDGVPIALSSASFTKLGTPSLKYQSHLGNGVEKAINGLYVSHNFFDLLDIPALISGQLAENEVIINRTMAIQLATQLQLADWREAKGAALKVSGFFYEKQVRVAGIVTDSPHFGIANDAKPVMYLSLKDQNPILANRIAPVFYSKSGNSAVVSSRINEWGQTLSPKLSYGQGNKLVEQIKDTDISGKLLFLTSSAMALLITFLVVFTLYNKFSYAVKFEQTKWAIMLAVGGRREALMVRMVLGNLMLALIGMLLTFSVLVMLEYLNLSRINLVIFQPLIWAICIATILMFIVFITIWAARGVFKQNISTLLRG
ncbi:FtsX-like permease family protein [Shewanella waksmanii]|uniref:FtsX-like permease family protein n=1 Tax=Shewanella waksmanii TaxID=213783 RepID=UPI003736542D